MTLRNSELDAERKSISKIQEYQSFRKHEIRDLNNQQDKEGQLDEYENRLKTKINDLEDHLLDIEMVL